MTDAAPAAAEWVDAIRKALVDWAKQVDCAACGLPKEVAFRRRKYCAACTPEMARVKEQERRDGEWINCPTCNGRGLVKRGEATP